MAPDFTGLSLRAALKLARRAGVKLEIAGHGYVTAQAPAPGAAISKAPITLTLASGLAAGWSGVAAPASDARPGRATAKVTLAAARRPPPRGD